MSDKIFNLEQRKVIYNAVRYYQANAVGVTSKSYQLCDEILQSLFEECKHTIEPAYLSDERV